MKEVVENFYTKCRRNGKLTLISLIGVSTLIASSARANEKEVWYDAQGVPVLVKDKTTGKLRRPSVKELEAHVAKRQAAEAKAEEKTEVPDIEERIDLEAKLRESITNSNPATAPSPTPSPLVTDPNATIPSYLVPRVYENQRFYVPQSRYYSPYYQSTYPYIFQPTVPRFSRNGSYGPVRYYHRPYYNHGYHNHYRRGCGNGVLLRYSRPGFSIRARF